MILDGSKFNIYSHIVFIHLIKYLGFILARLQKGGKILASNSFVYSFIYQIHDWFSSSLFIIVKLNGLSFTVGIIICYD